MPEKYDVIVVGAGNGGLIAAATTAKAGLKTLLIEKHNIPGGCATSFKRGRFEFEPSLHELAGYGSPENPGDVRELFDSLGVEVDMCRVDDAYRLIITGEDGYDITMPVGREAFIAKMEEYVPGSEQSTRQFFELADACGKAVAYLSSGPPDPAVLMTEHANFMRVANQTLQAVLDALNMPKRAQQIITAYWPYLGMPPNICDFLIFILMIDRYITYAAYIPKSRSHELSLAISKVIHDAGGDIWYNCPVERILIKDGTAYGVATAYGEVYADQIISNVIPHKVFGGMVDEAQTPKPELKRANARSIGCSAYCVYLGLSKSPEELGIKDYSIFIKGSQDEDGVFERMSTIETNEFQAMNCLNIANPGCSPEGTSILWSTQLYRGDAWTDVKPEDYKRVKTELAQKLIEQYETATGIKISDCIEEISIATPVTFARYLGTPRGSIYGYQGQMWDNMLSRTMTLPMEQWTKGLIFCGGHAFRMLGYSSSYKSGSAAAGQAIQAIRASREVAK